MKDVFLFVKGIYMNYKSTLLMPKTDFEMRGKLPTKEPACRKMAER